MIITLNIQIILFQHLEIIQKQRNINETSNYNLNLNLLNN